MTYIPILENLQALLYNDVVKKEVIVKLRVVHTVRVLHIIKYIYYGRFLKVTRMSLDTFQTSVMEKPLKEIPFFPTERMLYRSCFITTTWRSVTPWVPKSQYTN